MTAVAECPAENELVQFAQGTLSDTMRASVSEHLDSCESCRVAVAFAASDERTPLPTTPGTRVGRYVVEGLLGAGAMGSVFSAVDDVLHRRVALKLLHEGRDVARLEREAQSMARLNHPHVVTVFEFGAWEGGRYIAMELVDGVTLEAWLPGKSLAARRAVLLDAGDGLQAAHQGGVVHRDFKPANVLVSRDGRVKVTDFGLSRVAPGSPVPSSSMLMTQAGAIVGTPAYMSPEQLDGAVADERSDQFAFATVWLEALTGTRPFQGTSRDALRASMERAPTLASPFTAHEKRAVLRALHADPPQRFPSMEALLAELRRVPKRRWPVVALALALLALILGGVAWRWWPRPSEPEVMHKVRLGIGTTKSLSLGCVKQLAIGDPSVADVKTTDHGDVLVTGVSEGMTTMLVWKCDQERVDYAVRVADPSQKPEPPNVILE